MTSLIPGNISPEDKLVIQGVFDMLCGEETSLKVIDSLLSRYIFQIHNPKNLDSALLRSLKLKLHDRLKNLEFDLQSSTVDVECWRCNAEKRRKGCKRPRDADKIECLPENIVAALQTVANGDAGDMEKLSQLMLWVVNREERFCVFDVDASLNSETGIYTLRLENFERVALPFVRALHKQWHTFLHNVRFDWGSRALVLEISK